LYHPCLDSLGPVLDLGDIGKEITDLTASLNLKESGSAEDDDNVEED